MAMSQGDWLQLLPTQLVDLGASVAALAPASEAAVALRAPKPQKETPIG